MADPRRLYNATVAVANELGVSILRGIVKEVVKLKILTMLLRRNSFSF